MTQAPIGNTFTIRFGVQTNDVDALMFINSLSHTATIIQEINREINSGAKIDIRIKAIEKGSFLVHVELIETLMESLKNLLTPETISTGADIVGIFVALLNVKTWLKADKPQVVAETGDTVVIKNSMNDQRTITTHVYNLYIGNATVKDRIEQNFAAITNDPTIESFEILDPMGTPLYSATRAEYQDLSVRDETIQLDEKVITEIAILSIVKPSFDPALTWDFYYKGNRIGIKIKDPEFYKAVEKGRPFAKGDKLEVEIIIRQKYNLSVDTFVNKSIMINRIIRHIPRGEQLKIDVEE